MRPTPVWTSSQTNSVPASRHRPWAREQVALRGQVDALALHRLDHERRDVPARELVLEGVQITEATGSQPGNSGPKPSRNSAFPLSDSEPSVSPWKACSAYSTRGRPVAARATLIAASTASVPGVGGDHRGDAVGRAREQLLGEHPAEQRDAELRQVAVRACITSSIAAIASGWLRPMANTP